jgi:hypothetical protein
VFAGRRAILLASYSDRLKLHFFLVSLPLARGGTDHFFQNAKRNATKKRVSNRQSLRQYTRDIEVEGYRLGTTQFFVFLDRPYLFEQKNIGIKSF